MIFRQSLLKTYMACPLQAKFASIDKLPGKAGSKATFGSCIHAGLEHYNKTGDVDTAIKIFIEGWENPATLNLPEVETWNKFTAYGSLRTRGVEILKAYHDRMKVEQRSVIVAEHRFLVPFGEHELTGTVDLVSVRKNHRGTQLLTIEDYKTQAKLPNISELALNIQFTVYLYALGQPEFWLGNGDKYPEVPNGEWYYEMFKNMPRRGIWVHLWQNAREMDAGGRDDEDYARLYRLCCEVARAVQFQVFVPHIGEACQLCDYAHSPCPVTPPSREWWEKHRLDEDVESWA
jgi:hypothetical protein